MIACQNGGGMTIAAEKIFENKIKKYLKKNGCYFLKIMGGVPGIPNGTPDILACINGYFVGIEVKRPDGKGRVTQIQHYQLGRIEQAGGISFIADDWEETKGTIDRIIQLSKAST